MSTLLDDLWTLLWDDLRHNATGKPSGEVIIGRHRPFIEAEAARLDPARLRRALDLCGIGLAEGGHPASDWTDAIAAEYARLGNPA